MRAAWWVVPLAACAGGFGLLWTGCPGNDRRVGPAGASGQGGAALEAGAETGDGGPAADARVEDSSPPYDGAVACKWPGWYVHPRLPPGCGGICIPDDPAVRVPHVEWKSRDDWCAGCKQLAVATGPDGPMEMGQGVLAWGEEPTLFGVILAQFGLSDTAAVYDTTGTPRFAFRTDFQQPQGKPCGRMAIGGSVDEKIVAATHTTMVKDDQTTVIRPLAKLAELGTATDSTIVWPKKLVAGTVSDGISVSTTLAIQAFLGRAGIADLTTGATWLVEQMDGGPVGEADGIFAVGDGVVFDLFDGLRGRAWAWDRKGGFRVLLGGPDIAIWSVLTDGIHLVWRQGSQPMPDGGPWDYAKWGLYKSAFTTDPAAVKPVLLFAEPPSSLTFGSMRNGYVGSVYYKDPDKPGLGVDALVIRVADGYAVKSALPAGLSWGSGVYTAKNELWGVACKGAVQTCESAVRVPYSAMTVVQQASPGGG